MAGSERIAIVLSTFNGSAHLAAQIESIRRQYLRNWTLLVRDDGSSDETPQILRRFAALDPRIVILEDGGTNLGAIASFGTLLQAALDRGAEYVFLADQDDVWLPDKLNRQLALMRSHEERAGRDAVALVHSDLRVVRNDLQVINDSFMSFQRLRHEARDPLRVLLVQNFITGCTVLVNRALLQVALPIPPEAVMHDWWLGQCAAACGAVYYLPEPTVLYRQHAANVVGAKGFPNLVRRALRDPVDWWTRSKRNFSAGIVQCCLLAERLRERAEGNRKGLAPVVEEYCRTLRFEPAAMRRLGTVINLDVRPQTLIRRPFFYYRVLLGRGAAGAAGQA